VAGLDTSYVDAPGDCRITKFLVTCHQEQRLHFRQRDVLQLCEVRAKEIYQKWHKASQRIMLAQKAITGESVPNLVNPSGSEIAWGWFSPSAYANKETMVAAAWNLNSKTHRTMMKAFENCTAGIMEDYRRCESWENELWSDRIANAVADGCLHQAENWVIYESSRLEEAASALQDVARQLGDDQGGDEMDIDVESGADLNDPMAGLISGFSTILRL
jgi:hypothetical protein